VAVGITAALLAKAEPGSEGVALNIQAPRTLKRPPHANRLYGRVLTVTGREYEGFIRWDQNEGSWADILDASKHVRSSRVISVFGGEPEQDDTREPGTRSIQFEGGRISISGIRIALDELNFGISTSALAGLRFGHIRSIEVLDDNSALFLLKSGAEVELGADATDLGSNLRAVVVQDASGGEIQFQWGDLDVVEFMAAPRGRRPSGERLFGTITTRTGLEFTGYVAWDVDEIYTTDQLDGEEDGRERKFPFGSITAIERYTSDGAYVRFVGGEEIILKGSNDVDESNRGISISDVGLGQVLVSWTDFESVRFHAADGDAGYDDFDGGHPIRGTVTTTSNERFTGEIRWDADEEFSWEMLNGEHRDLAFQIEFGLIASITKGSFDGVIVELLDGRSFDLTGSNDVDEGNKGIFVTDADGDQHAVDWKDFASARFSNR